MKTLPKNVKINEKGSLVLVDSVGKEWNLDEIYDLIQEAKEKENRKFEEFAEKACNTIPVKDRLSNVRKIFCKSFPGSKRPLEKICSEIIYLLKRIEKEEHKKRISLKHVEKYCSTLFKHSKLDFQKSITRLKRSGDIFEPKKGFIQIV